MTISGFEPFANTTLTFVVSGDSVTVDPDTGNEIPVAVEDVYLAHLSQKKLPKYLAEAGVDETTIYLEGKLISPWLMGERLRPNAIAKADFQGALGEFELLPQENYLPSYKPWLGTPLRGLFRAYGNARPSEE